MVNLDWTVSTAFQAIQVFQALPATSVLPETVVARTVVMVPKDRLVYRALTAPQVNQEHLASLVLQAIPDILAPVYLVSMEFQALRASLDLLA